MDVLTSNICPQTSTYGIYGTDLFSYSTYHDENGNFFLPLHSAVWILAALFTFLSCILTFVLIYKHLRCYTKPEEQRLIIRLLLMIPFYTIFDQLAYTFIKQSVYFDTIRDVYQAASIISFFNLLLEYLGPTEEDRQVKISTIQSTRMPLPLCCWYFNPSKHRLFLPGLKISIYLVIIQTISSVIANLSLNVLFEAVRGDLIHQQLTLKDICVNWALFFVTYQGHALSLAVSLGLIQSSNDWTSEDISSGIQTSLASIEFFFISILQLKAFSIEEYKTTATTFRKASPPFILALLDALNPFDIINDFIYVVKFIFGHVLLGRKEPQEIPARPLIRFKRYERQVTSSDNQMSSKHNSKNNSRIEII
ncbi:hypothetical protein Glove_209g51 [Diversispora epigaea]|uniref:Organic solute transporter Ostalpha-domain-containing protein n=1 Tax=Diversispora epigaea TaxID=1348612 RepID=A0A397IS13_9GLOM|nr:hypothetical protein Glove_209g51 [Diversispora epigaea]